MNDRDSAGPFTLRTLLPVTLAILFLGVPYLLRPVAQALLVIFSGILLAVFLDGLARLLRRLIPLNRLAALALIIAVIVVIGSLFGLIAGPRIGEQTSQLTSKLPEAMERIKAELEHTPWLQELLSRGTDGGLGSLGSDLLSKAAGIFTMTFGVVVNFVIILFLGLFLAFNPDLYTGSLIRLIPPRHRERGEEVLAKAGHIMRWWLVGRFASMAVVGILTAIGLLIIGAPLALILGLIAGLLSFIPFLGPALSALPAVLIGFSEGPALAGKVVLVYVIVQALESNLITPIIQKRAVMLPPAFLIAAQFIFGVLLGFFGVLLATPLTVLTIVLVQMLYIQDVLGDPVSVIGDNHS